MVVFFDDIFIDSQTMDDHLHHLHIILKILADHTLFANEKKCLFGQSRVEFLGHVITQEGVMADPSKTEAMRNLPVPKKC